MISKTQILAVPVVMMLIVTACGSGSETDSGSSETIATSAATTTATDSPTTTAATPSTASADLDLTGGTVNGDLSFALAEGFTATWVGEGIKPDLELAPNGTAGIAFLTEDLDGSISYANSASAFLPETIVDGYFYGPIGLAYSPGGTPHVAFHDHQDLTFVEDKGDLTLAIGGDGDWSVQAIENEGHDGWDSTIAIGADGIIRAAGIDPAQFNRTQGVEYSELLDDVWSVTEIGSGPVFYEFNVSLAVDLDGNPALTYYDNNTADLMYASRVDGVWEIDTVDAEGDAGRYSSLAFDSAGTPHISYLRLDSTSKGTIRHATSDSTGWIISDVGSLDNIRTGFTGARRITSIAVDSDQRPHVMFSDETVVNYGVADDAKWNVTRLIAAGDRPLGQLVSFRLSDDGVVHLAISERLTESTGVIAYITG